MNLTSTKNDPHESDTQTNTIHQLENARSELVKTLLSVVMLMVGDLPYKDAKITGYCLAWQIITDG